jgi:hypothetical protein
VTQFLVTWWARFDLVNLAAWPGRRAIGRPGPFPLVFQSVLGINWPPAAPAPVRAVARCGRSSRRPRTPTRCTRAVTVPPVLDNSPAHTSRVWTAAPRCVSSPHSVADALRLPNSPFVNENEPGNLQDGGCIGGREGESWGSFALADDSHALLPQLSIAPSVGRSVAWAQDAPGRPRSRVRRTGLPHPRSRLEASRWRFG